MMHKPITVHRLFELFCDTISRCTSKNLELSDEELAHNLFEEFDVGATSFLHGVSLNRLFEAGLICERAKTLSQQIRADWFALQETDWTTGEIQTESAWMELFLKCDELLSLLPE